MSAPRPGLAVERTVLAWTRTWLAVAVSGLLLLRMTLGSTPPRLAAAVTVAAVALVLVALAGRQRAIRLRSLAAAPPRPDPTVDPRADRPAEPPPPPDPTVDPRTDRPPEPPGDAPVGPPNGPRVGPAVDPPVRAAAITAATVSLLGLAAAVLVATR